MIYGLFVCDNIGLLSLKYTFDDSTPQLKTMVKHLRAFFFRCDVYLSMLTVSYDSYTHFLVKYVQYVNRKYDQVEMFRKEYILYIYIFLNSKISVLASLYTVFWFRHTTVGSTATIRIYHLTIEARQIWISQLVS